MREVIVIARHEAISHSPSLHGVIVIARHEAIYPSVIARGYRHCEARSNLVLHNTPHGKEIASFLAMTDAIAVTMEVDVSVLVIHEPQT